MFQTLLNILFPRQCLSCGKFGSYFCQACIPSLKTSTTTICPMCTKLSPFGMTHPYCKTRYSLDGLTSVFRYTGAIQKGIKTIKYRRVRDIVPELTSITMNAIQKDKSNNYVSIIRIFDTDKPIIIPIPLHKKRYKERWFNQSELLAKEISEKLHLEMRTDLLHRIKFHTPQAELKKEDRLKNIKGAFSINPKSKIQMSNLSIILLDDVWTTGATLREAGNMLKRTGVKKVWGLTIAR